MMRNEVLGTLNDPGKVADTQLVGVEQRRGKRQARRISKPLRSPSRSLSPASRDPPSPESFGRRKIEAQQIATIIGHTNILTPVRMFEMRLWPGSGPGSTSFGRPRASGVWEHTAEDGATGGDRVLD